MDFHKYRYPGVELAQKRSKKGELGSFHTLNGLYVFEKG